MNLACVATRIAEAMRASDIVYLADDEQQADAIAAALAAIVPAQSVFFLPSSDTFPGDSAPASPANAGRRVATLRRLRATQAQDDRPRLACILSGEGAARRYASPEAFDTAPPQVRVGDAIDIAAISETLEQLGYIDDDRVDEPGEMAVRGGVIDVFPADAVMPARIDVADGVVAAIRSYDRVTQRSAGDLDALEIGRAVEPAVEEGVALLAHLAPGCIALSANAEARRQRFVQLARDAAGGGVVDAIDDDAWAAALAAWSPATFDDAIEDVPRFAEARSPLAALARFAKPLLKNRAFVLAGSKRDLRFLRARVSKRLSCELEDVADWAALRDLAAGDGVAVEMPVDAGFVDDKFVWVAAADLLGSRALLGDASDAASALETFGAPEIRVGDVVVHEDHGIGVVVGLEAAPDGAGEMIALDYAGGGAGGGRRLVPVDAADRLWRYGADAEAVTLDTLNGSSWAKRRGDIDAAIAESARGLTELAAARAQLEAPVLDPDAAAYERFARRFPFNETADQARAIAAVRADLTAGKPMDRLVVGDVGYGKTEVALRAAALAALAGYQVIVAAPTTVLVRQHLESFRKRFAGTDFVVAGLSRLSTSAEKKAVKTGLADGSVQIVIGTGAVMGKGIAYARLGLVVIDEEQRFGAADKARLRGDGAVHLLTLSATPIPRTLQMALVGLQQISIIATPPARRQPIRTSIDQYDDNRIRTALLREKARGGQSFVVVPRIEDMAELAEKLRRVVPDLVLVEAHGKMPAAGIDEVMVGFADARGDVLLATNIIEAGLDVPRANTMIVWRADRFGLAQLHQLRGRVGRGHRRGQVILLTTGENAVAERTAKRLRTLAAFDRLGAGFEISAQDLDMRGAGDLLGDDQAGHTKLIGVDLYQHLLGAALRKARGEEVERWAPELHLCATGALPEAWIPAIDLRLSLYVRLARIADEGGLDALEEELVDRFGPLPPEAETLLATARIRLAARALRIERIDAGPAAIALTPRRDFTGDMARVGLTEKNGRFLLSEATDDAGRIARVEALLEQLTD